MQAPAPLAARQWRKVFDIGKSFGIPLAAVSSLCTAYVAYHRAQGPPEIYIQALTAY